jgi:LmbE family N-acetylglucosaminyl deacetylase
MMTAGQLHKRWRALPFGSLDDVTGGATCLILAPHPDDESLGCGGLIAACCSAGRPPLVAVLTDGSGSHPGSQLYPPAKLIALREAEAMAAVDILGLPADRLSFLRERDTSAPIAGPRFRAVVQKLAHCVSELGCSAILAPWRLDPHGDHQAAARIAEETARLTGIALRAYPVWGWTLGADTTVEEPSVRGWRLDITLHLSAKRRAIAAHASQYGKLITDDPGGFRLPEELLRTFESFCETFLLP